MLTCFAFEPTSWLLVSLLFSFLFGFWEPSSLLGFSFLFGILGSLVCGSFFYTADVETSS